MPELPEVETIRSQLQDVLPGSTVSGVRLRRRDVLRSPTGSRRGGRNILDWMLGESTIREVERRGKQLHIASTCGRGLVVRLGMSGRLILQPPDDPPCSHRHATWDLVRGSQTFKLHFVDPRRFGGLFATRDPKDLEARFWSRLGPDAFGVGSRILADRLQRTRRVIKTALLDQSLVAGLGNIYVDEALHEARISPLRPANSLMARETNRLGKAIRRILKAACTQGGTTLRDYRQPDGSQGEFSRRLRAYGRGGKPCDRCGSVLVTEVIGGRTTTWCAVCQELSTENSHPHLCR